MNKETQSVLKHLKNKAYISPLNQQIVLPTIRQTNDALELNLEQIEEAYQDLLELGQIEQYSEYQFIPGLQFALPQKIKDKLRLGY